MHDRGRLVAANLASYDALEKLFGGLADEQWAVPSLCPDWDARAVLVHRVSVEHVLTGWEPSTENPPPFQLAGEFEAAVVDLSDDALLDRAREVWAARRSDLDSVTQATVELPSMTPAGVGLYGDFLRIRVMDAWVHERDVAIPLGIPTDDSGPTAEYALDEVEGAIGYIVGKKIGLDDGLGITFHVTGGVTRDIHAAVDGRAARVESLDDPVCEITADVVTFMMLACGRGDPQEQMDAGKITWTGDDTWGRKAATNLAYTR